MHAFIVSRTQAALLLMAAAAFAYVNAFAGVFHFDDVTILTDPHLEDLSKYLAHIGVMIRPSVKLTFLVDRRLWGSDPAGYHLLNLVLHIGSGLLVYAIFARLVEAASGTQANVIAFWAALLFLMHPVATETVTYISGRPTGLMSFWYLAGLYLYLRATESSRSSLFTARYFGAIACLVLALLSKEIAITFPLALLLVDGAACGWRGAELRERFVQWHLPFWGVLLAYVVFAAMHPRYTYLLDYSLGLRPIAANLATQANVLAYALSLFIFPGRLTIEHDFRVVHSVLEWPAPASLALIAGMVAAALLLRRRNPLASFGLLWFFLQILPTNSVIPRADLLSERNLYLAAPGLFLALAALWMSLVCRLRQTSALGDAGRVVRGLFIVPFVVAGLLGAMTVLRNTVYADPVALWSDAARKTPGKARVHVNLGQAHFAAGDLDRAIAEFRLALHMDPDNPIAQSNLRATWRRKGNIKAE